MSNIIMTERIETLDRRHRGRRRRQTPTGACRSCRTLSLSDADDDTTTKPATVPRKRPRPWPTPSRSVATASLLILSFTNNPLLSSNNLVRQTSAAVLTWSNGPEDQFFCGQKWNDPNCATRQNCRSGQDPECEGHDTHGIKCFANTQCDVKYGGAAAWTEGAYLDGGGFELEAGDDDDDDDVDFDSLLDGGLFAPTRSPVHLGGPTLIPTEYPIAPPPPLDPISNIPSDHWFCGIGLHDANDRCATHCPNSLECPLGEICYFGTECDGRTHEPTPPPTRRPTPPPTTSAPTVSFAPTEGPTVSARPTAAPTMPGPTFSPTNSPTKRPSYAPLSNLAQGFFCGLDWSDTTSLCKKRCPTGEDTECPNGEFCFAYTGCQEERGYGDDPSKWVPGYNEWGNSIADQVAALYGPNADVGGEGGSNNGGGSSNNGGSGAMQEDRPLCYNAEVTITSDNWPQEITWKIIDFVSGQDVVVGSNDGLDPNEPVTKTTCLPSWGCYQFTIYDAGGDGLCCEHGNGMYRVRYAGLVVGDGAAFYDEESVEFGCATEEPTRRPTARPTRMPTREPVEGQQQQSNGNNGPSSSGSMASGANSPYRCVANPLVDAGYVVSERFCDKFVDCYNEYIETSDDWFCQSDEICVDAPACGGVAGQEPEASEEVVSSVEEVDQPAAPAGRPSPSRPNPSPSVPVVESRPDNTQSVMDISPTKMPTPMPTEEPTAPLTTAIPTMVPPTYNPTEVPTLSPTAGPCGGNECAVTSHCRSKFGFCGPGEYYCTDTAIWSEECLTQPTQSPVTPEPTTFSPVTDTPTAIPTADPTAAPTDNPTVGAEPVVELAWVDISPSDSSSEIVFNTMPNPTDMPTPNPTDMPTPKPTASAAKTTTSAAAAVAAMAFSNNVIVNTTPNPTEMPAPKPTRAPTTSAKVYSKPFSKPSGGGKPKPSGGKGPHGGKHGGKHVAADEPSVDDAIPIKAKPAPPAPMVPAFQTRKPSNSPTKSPTDPPTNPPTNPPTHRPTHPPTTARPTTATPTTRPTASTAAGELIGLATFTMIPPPTSRPTRSPTSEPTPDPTKYPTKHPTKHPIENINYETLSADSADFVMITNAPTPEPTRKAATASSSSSSKGFIEQDNPYSCTAEPCEDEAWCRSRYGSCGPGFIYCNSNSSWKKTCPPVAPRPTKPPTHKPTREPIEPAAASAPGVPAPSNEPPTPSKPAAAVSFPTLPKPTLPVITQSAVASSSSNFLSQSSYMEYHQGMTGPEKASSSEDESLETSDGDEEFDDDVAKIFRKNSEQDEEEEGEGEDGAEEKDWKAEREDTSEYVGYDEWLGYTSALASGGAIATYASNGGILSRSLFVLASLSLLLFA